LFRQSGVRAKSITIARSVAPNTAISMILENMKRRIGGAVISAGIFDLAHGLVNMSTEIEEGLIRNASCWRFLVMILSQTRSASPEQKTI